MDETLENTHAPEVDTVEDPADSSDAPAATVDPSRSVSKRAVGITVMVGVVVLALITTQILILNSLNETKAEIAVVQEEVALIGGEINGLEEGITELGTDLEELVLADALNSDNSSALETPTQTAPTGYLPRFDRNTPDQALGMAMGTIDGVDGYTEELVSIDPADGKPRVWMVWAHWCPYCQEELPILTDWYPTASDQYEAELVTVSTNIDPSRGNPLEEYLAESQFPFPVIVDVTNDAAVKMGISAFPFWVVTDGDGVVLLRSPGLLDATQVEHLFTQLESLES